MDSEVRRIEPDQWPSYRELRLEALQDSPLAFVEQYAESVAKPDEFWQDRVARAAAGPHSAMFVAWFDDCVVGKASAFRETDVTTEVSAHIVGVYVTPDHRGTGVAQAVVRAAMGWALDELGATVLRLYVTDVNPRARAFYQRLGFALTGVTLAYPPDVSITEHELTYRPG